MNDTQQGDAVIEVTLHQFKNHISEYLTRLRTGEVSGIVLKRYRRRVAFLTAAGPGAPARPLPART